MKRLMSAALALALLSGTAASADPFGNGPRWGHHDRWDRGWDRGRRHHDDGAGTAIAVGVGLLALTAIIAASDNDREERRVRAYDYPPPPPPPPPGYQDRYYPAPDRDRYYDQSRDYRNRPADDDGYRSDQD
jgi:hypothetical protein